MSYQQASSQDMIDLEGLLGGPTPPSSTVAAAGTGGGGDELSLDRTTIAAANVGAASGSVDLAKHPSGIVPVLQYKKSICSVGSLTGAPPLPG